MAATPGYAPAHRARHRRSRSRSRGGAKLADQHRDPRRYCSIYFVGIDQGAISIFGADMHIHEFVHDARHFLGFPCH